MAFSVEQMAKREHYSKDIYFCIKSIIPLTFAKKNSLIQKLILQIRHEYEEGIFQISLIINEFEIKA